MDRLTAKSSCLIRDSTYPVRETGIAAVAVKRQSIERSNAESILAVALSRTLFRSSRSHEFHPFSGLHEVWLLAPLTKYTRPITKEPNDVFENVHVRLLFH